MSNQEYIDRLVDADESNKNLVVQRTRALVTVGMVEEASKVSVLEIKWKSLKELKKKLELEYVKVCKILYPTEQFNRNLNRQRRKRKNWTVGEIQVLKKYYNEKHKLEEIANALKRPIGSISFKIKQLVEAGSLLARSRRRASKVEEYVEE